MLVRTAHIAAAGKRAAGKRNALKFARWPRMRRSEAAMKYLLYIMLIAMVIAATAGSLAKAGVSVGAHWARLLGFVFLVIAGLALLMWVLGFGQ